ncbi:hypothetical protein GLOTRDRAFT_131678 [Gloeophyllum trabeum ATCC 11539]|uniref:F-box domain-containing protein n=1 Tax=Gloeophyllum trabeum (strain ATCC 11539 / FP-39264 / Madison 617) TaxID=670483 RepID=S7PXU7_GLOTA|nr:uncharacterized protein GLOTRDRAFT_131678 [Gloeophyllum trabeum ATCC 11539]EPQ52436.1 hypothetical protein GLOTRDRAFT_131678 [Gloeophyllum trabeum ATCC 11539]
MAYKQTLSLDILHEIIQYYFADTPSRHTSSLADDATRLKLVCKDWNRIVSKILQNPTKTVPPISKLPVELHHKIFSYVLAHDPNDQWLARPHYGLERTLVQRPAEEPQCSGPRPESHPGNRA